MANLEKIVLPEDMTEDECREVRQYITNGLPGLLKTNSTDIFQWFELYMSGKTYKEIARLSNANASRVLYIAYKSKWHDKRMEHYKDLFDNLTKKLTHVKLSSANTMTTIVTALGTYYEKAFNKYLQQKDASIIDDIDTKLLTQYFKSMDTLEKIITNGKDKGGDSGGSGMSVNINMMGGNATIEKKQDDTIEITDENAGDFLKNLIEVKKIDNNEEKK